MHIRPIRAGDGPLLKLLTIRSVEDAPHAFAGVETLDEELQRPDSEWETLAAECASEVEAWRDRCVGYFVVDGETACGKALVYLSDKIKGMSTMSAVWIDPRYRRRGFGRQLVHEACVWAASKNAVELHLWVDDTNPDGAKFYSKLGFRPTGKSRPVRRTSSDLERAFALGLPTRDTRSI